MKTMTFGILGCEHAHIGVFLEEMLALGHVCAGIYDPRHTALASQLAAQHQVPLLSECDRLLAEEVKLIGTSAIHNEKIEVIETCERHGKPVMVDKPAVTDREGYRRLKAVMDRGVIQVGMLLTERFQPAIHALKQLIDRGDLGQLVSIGIRKPHRLSPESRPPWFFSKTQSGGIIVDLLIHDFDLLRWLTGSEIRHAEGVAVKRILPEHPDFYDAASLQVLMDNGLVAQLYADWHTPRQSWTWGDGRIFVAGTRGSAECRLAGDPLAIGAQAEPLLLTATHTEPFVQARLDSPPSITADFLKRLEGGDSILTGEDILASVKAAIDADERSRFIVSDPLLPL
ncbi:Gfo/Idh/MocA family protein [Paenibacillus pasadenensis]|uniref:Flavohemoprotein (Hemoglobin-like protein) (Flavohemoglobin) (Nitric oxide dioxygenase) n=1 Tax=Paenibacillus pasadenensis TaxID=217090 RepID=A0A2N5N556_9BACL|nr:Gfo/Idh/MocA family oxidoreductase [Paenibacillus pasadenensis]PLT45443.1 Flavohemoprotein (Hemoglobin-like protein) (Flavohemoglobin) (Nitric oxide dioxygenase) [Paenibacillus pasadenensis]